MSLDALNHVSGVFWGRRARGHGRTGSGFVVLLKTVGLWHQRSKQRMALLALDERMLEDIGLNRAKAEREAAKPFWRE